jgi:hypothetical protein
MTSPKAPRDRNRRCGLCGKTVALTKTECCGQWICDDADKYVMFSYSRDSCYRNHARFTLCGYHHSESHDGTWLSCARCHSELDTEDYVHFGTNEYNFQKLADPPSYESTRCSKCSVIIVRSEGGYSTLGRKFYCGACGP